MFSEPLTLATGRLAAAAAGVVLSIVLSPPVALDAAAGAAEITVVDGDTLEVDGRIFELEGIDAPELGQICLNGEDEWKCGLEAALTLRKVISLNPVACQPVDAAAAVLTGRCLVNETDDLARIQVEAGYAVAIPELELGYQEAEAKARLASLGLWRGPFELPWEWRRRTEAELSGPAAVAERCMVKGMINEAGDKVYYVPSDPEYREQIVDRARGERLFCSDDQARVEGWSRTPR